MRAKTLSDFNKQIEKFFITKNLESDDLGSIVYLTRELRKRNVEKYFDQLISEIRKVRREKLGIGFQNILKLAELNFEEFLMYNSRNDRQKMAEIALERTELMEFAIAHAKLFEQITLIMYTPEKYTKETGRFAVSETLKFVEKYKGFYSKYYPNVWTLYLIFRAIDDNYNYKKIYTAYDYFLKNEKSFNEEFLQFTYDFILKLIFSKMDVGESRAFEDFYKIVLHMTKSGVMDKIHHIQPRLFPGFILVSTNAGNFELAECLVTKYSDKVVASLRAQVTRIGMGIIELAKGNYDNVRKLLDGEKPRDSMLNIFCKTTLIKAYYEKGDYRNIYPLSDTLKHFLKRRKDIATTHSNIIKFLNYTSKLAQVKKKNGIGLEYIEPLLMKEKYFFQKNWVMKKFQELKSAY